MSKVTAATITRRQIQEVRRSTVFVGLLADCAVALGADVATLNGTPPSEESRRLALERVVAAHNAAQARRYRYECPCGARGRWRVNPNDAHADGERHHDRFETGHDAQLVDDDGKGHGSTH